MSEAIFQLENNGQQVIVDDFNLLGRTAGLADDRILAEIFRPIVFDETNVSKGILPYGVHSQNNADLIEPGIGAGKIRVNPFRALIGSRTSYHTSTLDNWRDVRSAICVGTSQLSNSIGFAAASGSPRWDLVYAAVAVDANGPSVTRKVKNPVTKVITGTTVHTYLQTTVTLLTLAGTPSATPTFPAAPADTGSTYYIPIAYVWIPTSYSPTYTFGANSVVTVANCISLSLSTGGRAIEVADQQYKAGGTVVTATNQQGWLAAPPHAYIPPTQTGELSLRVAIDMANTSVGSHSHAGGAVIDSRDWRGRYCFYRADIAFDGSPWPWEDGVSPTAGNIAFASASLDDGTGNGIKLGSGQTIIQNFNGTVAGTSLLAFIAASDSIANADFAIYCDHTDGGKLKLYKPSNPRVRAFFQFDFSPPFGARTHV